MSAEREQMQVRLANMHHRERQLKDKILTICSFIRANLNTMLIQPENLDVPATAGHMDDLVMAYGDLQNVIFQITRLEKELE
jgi:hypothetical protein